MKNNQQTKYEFATALGELERKWETRYDSSLAIVDIWEHAKHLTAEQWRKVCRQFAGPTMPGKFSVIDAIKELKDDEI